MTKTPKNIIDEQTRLETERKDYEKLKALSTVLSNPGRSDQWDYYCQFDDDAKRKGNTTIRKVYDPTAFRGLGIWTNGIMGHYMPREIDWFMGEMADRKIRDSKNVKKWLQETDEHMSFVLKQSSRSGCGYYDQKRVTIGDAASIGDSFLFIDQDSDSDKLLFMAPHPREFFIKRDYWGRVICIHHRFAKTIQQIADEFGKDKGLSETQKLALEKSPNQKTTIIHAVYRNVDYEPDKIGIKNMPWQHYYVNVTSSGDNAQGIKIRETGSYTLNPVPWSLNRPSHESYGRGIVSQMLVEILTANFMSKDLLIASSVAARPPMLITSALAHKLDLGAGGVNFVSSRENQGLKMGDLVARLIDSSGYPFGQDNHLRWQNMIDERFGVPLFLALNVDDTSKTAYETRERQAERATMMAPFLGTLGNTTDMEFDRIYSLELQANRAPEPPMEVLEAQNGRIDVQYIGPLFQLLKQYYETGSLLTTIANIQAAMSVAPESKIVFDGDVLMRKILQSGNAPEDMILSKDDVMEIKAIAAQQQEEQMAAQLAAEASKAVPNLSKKIEKDSFLSNLRESLAA